MITRGDIHWIDLGAPVGSRPAGRRPVVVVQSWGYNASTLATTVVAVITSNLNLAAAPGNVLLPAAASGLPRDSVVNVTQLATVNKADLGTQAGRVPPWLMQDVSAGLRRVLLDEANPEDEPMAQIEHSRGRTEQPRPRGRRPQRASDVE